MGRCSSICESILRTIGGSLSCLTSFLTWCLVGVYLHEMEAHYIPVFSCPKTTIAIAKATSTTSSALAKTHESTTGNNIHIYKKNKKRKRKVGRVYISNVDFTISAILLLEALLNVHNLSCLQCLVATIPSTHSPFHIQNVGLEAAAISTKWVACIET